MVNSFSSVARVMLANGVNRRPGNFPTALADLQDEMFAVPERPEDFTDMTVRSPSYSTSVLVTGGLDSSVLYFSAKLRREQGGLYDGFRAYYVNSGQPYYEKEIRALYKLGIKFDTLHELSMYPVSSYWKHILPARNFLYLSLVAERMGMGEIWFGVTNGEMPERGGDKSKTFLKIVNDMFATLPYPVVVTTPVSFSTKTDLVAWWKDNLSLELLDYTVSCFSTEEGHCGQCQACLRKWIAYTNNGLELKTTMPVKLGCKEYIEKYKRLMSEALDLKTFTKYSEKRCRQDLAALRYL